MQDHEKTKDQLIDELNEIRSRLAETERMKYQRDIQRQNEFLNNVIESLPHPFYVIDVNDYTIKMANSASGQFQSSGEPQTCYRLTHNRYEPCSLGGDLCPLEIVRSTGKPATVEHVHYDKHGNPINVEVHAYPVFDDQGNLAQVIETSYDITERKRVEESLKETSAFLNTLMNAIPAPVFYKDTDGRYIGFNNSYEKFYGKTRQELVGKTVFDIAPRDLAEVYHAKDNELFDNPGVQIYDSQVKDSHGAVHEVVFHKSTFSDSQGRVLGLIGVILDITERKQLEKEKENLIIELQKALSKVKTLSGFLPICASCKKIRDDKGYWNQVERYISEHSEAEFSHSICPECMRALYPEYADEVIGRLEKDEKK
ncbi:MAG: PAS domain-containing protein [Desulfomonilaceae bacterium]